jgi:hypothetical protein
VRAVAEELCSPALPLVVDRTALRWQRLLDVALAGFPATTRRRPDVLALTCDALAMPEHPHTRSLVDFAICKELRARYGIGDSPSDVERLRSSFQELEESFEGRQRRRIKKDSSPHAHFLVDIVNMSGHVWRAPDALSFDAYCAGFSESPFGVESRLRDFGLGHWPELFGQPPPFASVIRRVYGLPLGVPGLDEVLGALQVPFPAGAGGGGAITLISGPSGSGRTTLLSAIASALSELGLASRFVSADETTAALESRLRGLSALTPAALWSRWLPASGIEHEPLEVTSAESLAALRTVVLPRPEGKRKSSKTTAARRGAPRAVFLDGIAALLDPQARGSKSEARGLFGKLRSSGIHVFASCTDSERESFELDRLADNVLKLDFHSEPNARHTTRVLSVSKTRLQSSQRDRHVLNIGEAGGCWVSPSLHTVNRGLHPLDGSNARSFPLPYRDTSRRRSAAPSLRDGSHVFIHGPGKAGKTSLALACALASSSTAQTEAPSKKRSVAGRAAPPRTLVISFLDTESHFRRLASRALHGDASPSDTLTVWTLYPGHIDAETFVSKVQRHLATADLLGRPFESIVLDGLHSLLLGFPLLRTEPLLWPTLFRLLKARGVRTVSTFSSFDAEGPADSPAARIGVLPALLGTCDYCLEMTSVEEASGRSHAQVRVVASPSDGLRVGDRYTWENDALVRASR